MPALPNSSLVGLALVTPPGRGEPGARVVPRAAGPIDWRAVAFLLLSTGAGEGLGLVEGGRRLAMVRVKMKEKNRMVFYGFVCP
jgi:hypothetical protein